MSYRNKQLCRAATTLACLLLSSVLPAQAGQTSVEADVCVYAATPSGILAAVAVRREGRSVVVVEPSRWVGGVLGAGLKPMQDCPNYNATGGLTKELLRTLGHPEWSGGEVGDGERGLPRGGGVVEGRAPASISVVY